MKVATAPIRRMISIGAGLAVGATALLAAPATAGAAPPEGAYWHTRTLHTTTHPWRFGSRSNPYSLVERQIVEQWAAPDGRWWYGFRELGVRPKSAADRKAWRRDGSPRKWSESIDGKIVRLSAEPSKGRVGPVPNETAFQLAEQRLTYDEVQRLPADPNGLKGWLTKAAQVARVPATSVDAWVTGTLREVLHALPAPKEVRAAAYQALLTMPGVRAQGAAKDALGRPGVAVLIERTTRVENGTITTRTEVIVDTGRMVLLSQGTESETDGMTMADRASQETLVDVGWTDSAPAVPALP